MYKHINEYIICLTYNDVCDMYFRSQFIKKIQSMIDFWKQTAIDKESKNKCFSFLKVNNKYYNIILNN